MKRILILSIVLSFGISAPVYSQSFLNKALKKLDNAVNSADAFLNGTQEQNNAKPQETQHQQTPQSGKQYVTDWQKHNLKGRVETITELEMWDHATYKGVYTFSRYGMLETYKSDDGEVECSYSILENGVPLIATLSIAPAPKDYPGIVWEGETYMERYFHGWYDGFERIGRGIVGEEITRTRMDGGRVERADVKNMDGGAIATYYRVFDGAGNLTAEYMDNMEGNPIKVMRYDDKNRVVYKKGADDVVHEYKYNDNGDVSEHKITNTFGEDENSLTTFTYRYDSTGNWIEKTSKDQDGETLCRWMRSIEYLK